jgi:hypothetical protein
VELVYEGPFMHIFLVFAGRNQQEPGANAVKCKKNNKDDNVRILGQLHPG